MGRPINELFSSWDPDPIGAASVGQVHRAVLKPSYGKQGGGKEGIKVAVKVQYPTTTKASSVAAAAGSKRKGLLHFAVRVCEKVEEKGVTTYNEVTDELVNEERACRQQLQQQKTAAAAAEAKATYI